MNIKYYAEHYPDLFTLKSKFNNETEYNTKLFPQYKLIKILGYGANSIVFLVLDRYTTKNVTIKLTKTLRFPVTDDDIYATNSFINELNCINKCKSNFILKVIDYSYVQKKVSVYKQILDIDDLKDCIFADQLQSSSIKYIMSKTFDNNFTGSSNINNKYNIDTYYYLVTEYIAGWDLRKLIKNGKYNTNLQFIIFVQIVLGVYIIHSNDIIHRDLKPANIFVDDTCLIKIGDFGFASELNSNLQEFLGTSYYMAPEIYEHKIYDEKIDIYALGIIFYELVTCKRPFIGNNMDEIKNNIIDRKYIKLPSYIAPEIHYLFDMMTHSDSTKRPSIKELLNTDFMRLIINIFCDFIVTNNKINVDRQQAILEEIRKILIKVSTNKSPFNDSLKNYVKTVNICSFICEKKKTDSWKTINVIVQTINNIAYFIICNNKKDIYYTNKYIHLELKNINKISICENDPIIKLYSNKYKPLILRFKSDVQCQKIYYELVRHI